jgi:PAS domain S-box-containing protein
MSAQGGDETPRSASAGGRAGLRKALALSLPFVALAVQLVLWRYLDPFAWLMFYAAVIASSWIGGLRAGLAATAISLAMVWWFFVPPTHAVVKDADRLVPATVFTGLGVLASVSHDRVRRSQERLREALAERRVFEAFLENSADFIAIADVDGKPKYVNPAGRRLVGMRADQSLATVRIADFYPPDVRASIAAAIEETLEHENWKGESRFRNWTTEETIPVSQVRFLIRDRATGRVLGLGLIARDVTDRNRLERSLRDASADLSRAQAVADVGSWRLDVARDEIVLSAQTYRIFGIAQGTPITREAFRACVHPDDREYVDRKWAAAVAGEPYDIEHRIVVEGVTRWVREKAELEHDEHGALLGGIGIVQDITERKRLESEQKLLAEMGSVLASTLDYETTLTNVVELAVRDFADYCIVDLVVEGGEVRRFRVGCRDPANGSVCDVLQRAPIGRKQPFWTASALATMKSVLICPVTDEMLVSFARSEQHLAALRAMGAQSAIGAPLVAHGTLLGAIGFVSSRPSRAFDQRDVALAEQVAVRAALSIENARLYRAAQRAVASRDDVLGIVAHDLRNPLNTIGLQAAVLHRYGGEATRQPAEAIRRALRRMNRLIEDLLDVTRLEAGSLTLERSRVSAVQVLADTVDAQTTLAESAGLDLRLAAPRSLPDVWADRDRLLQVFENLLGNAFKFSARGGQVTVGATPREHDVLFSVADTGAGIAPEEQPHVFDRFWQARKARHRGAGLGLPIVKGLVEAHGGRIWLESAPGRGTTFYFTIPSARREAVAPDGITRTAEPPARP